MPGQNLLFRGDNLEVLRNHITHSTVDLCYIDPPFHSQRNYNQIYNNAGGDGRARADNSAAGGDGRARARAFSDTWSWDDAATEGFDELLANDGGRYHAKTIDLIRGLQPVLGRGSLLAYLVGMARRMAAIHHVLKPTGSLFLHCDPVASHYLKLLLDSTFCPWGGDFRNEIVWCYSHGGKSNRWFGRKHDLIFFYSKSETYQFDPRAVRVAMRSGTQSFGGRLVTENGRKYRLVYGTKNARGETRYYKYYLDEGKVPEDWWTDINSIQASSAERRGYPTQKPEALLERIIGACSRPGDTVLDAYCGSGTSMVAAERHHRAWIGIDLSPQAISLVLERMRDTFGPEILERIAVSGL